MFIISIIVTKVNLICLVWKLSTLQENSLKPPLVWYVCFLKIRTQLATCYQDLKLQTDRPRLLCNIDSLLSYVDNNCSRNVYFRNEGDRRRDDEINSFERFRNSLTYKCEDGDKAVLQVL